MMFIVRCYNEATGHVETVSATYREPEDDGATPDPERRNEITDRFARHDSNTDHVYYAATVS